MQPVLGEHENATGTAADGQLPPGSEAPQAAPRVCDTCGSTMAAEQDWCLECGTAAPGRLGTRPGLRAMLSVAGATLLLAGGAITASYAALSEDAKIDAGGPAPAAAGPIAQAVPDLPPASVPPAPTGAAGAPAAPTGAAALPTVTLPEATKPAPSTPVTPVVPSTPITPVTPSGGGSTDTDTGSSGGSGSTGGGSDSGTDTTTEEDDTKETTPSLTAIELGADTVSIYDPYGRVTAKGDPVDAYDNDRDTAFRVSTADPAKPMGVGLVIDLEKATKVRAIELLTDTPGYRVELYGTKSSEIPKDVIDTRWEHYADRSKVDESTKDGNVADDAKERISLRGVRDARYVLVWITTPPTKSPTVRIQELSLLK
ncbi:hypothetical protein [Paraconexibacter algicola]|uniref:Uncharacterized protein n=1 Tax=Paraconexibacter algicola TaxID=2133960 RepID=A0A2T4UHL8_9ACTN|nr:hypothetical protein [Paraconexibacter algicola]PTL58695.1 hypothetical protein C7Y72_03040 [Paraconexibacter algicola]